MIFIRFFFSIINFFSKHVVFGHVISGQSIVDTIENLPVDSNTNRPLKDVIISHCGQLEILTSKLIISSQKEKS
jgi:cyclophilin family peptidyl-prolyl cis-trans isomerase